MAFIMNAGGQPDNYSKAPIVVPWQLDYLTPAGTYTIPIPAGYRVCQQTWMVVAQAFDATSPAMKHGDGDDDDGYLDSTDIGLATALSVTVPACKVVEDSGNPYANGKYYPTADTYDIVFDPGTGGTTGVAKGEVWMTNITKGGVPAGLTTRTPL